MILVTGSNGFVGSALCATLRAQGSAVRGAVRHGESMGTVAVGQLDRATDWRTALIGCDTVVHLAARVHMMRDQARNPLEQYREVNLHASVNLARQASHSGVKRFVFVSSIKVNGEATGAVPFRADDVPAPSDPYGQSKYEAEQALFALGRETGLEVVVVRPPLVYGPGVKANFLNLIKLVAKGIPLPFGAVRNQRSMVALENLVDLIQVCTVHPGAPGRVFLVSDGADLTPGELTTMIATAMGKRQVLLPLPPGLMRAVAAMVGKSALSDRLLNSLRVDIAPTRAALEWSPVVTPQAAIERTVEAFLAARLSEIV